MIRKGVASAADVVLLDLEDAVAPTEKEAAREAAGRALVELDWGRTTRAVRVNAVDSPWCYVDIVEVVRQAGSRLDLLIVPKVRSERDVWFVDTLLTQLERSLDLADGSIKLEILVEDAMAMASVEALARCCGRIESLVLGTADLAASLGMPPAAEASEHRVHWEARWQFARTRLTVASRAAAVQPVDGPWGDINDLEGCRQDALAARAIGMAGKWVIHPSQIPVVNEVITPSAQVVADAKELLEVLVKAESVGRGAVQHRGRMVDVAHARSCRDILLQAEDIRHRDSETPPLA